MIYSPFVRLWVLYSESMQRRHGFRFELRPNGAQIRRMRSWAGYCRLVFHRRRALLQQRHGRHHQCSKGRACPDSLWRYFACGRGVGPGTRRSDSGGLRLSAVGILGLIGRGGCQRSLSRLRRRARSLPRVTPDVQRDLLGTAHKFVTATSEMANGMLREVSRAADRITRHSPSPRSAPASAASAGR